MLSKKLITSFEIKKDGEGSFKGVPKEYILANKEKLQQAQAQILIASKTQEGKYVLEQKVDMTSL